VINIFFAIGTVASAALSKKIDRRLITIGLNFFCGLFNFGMGPSPWLNFSENIYVILTAMGLMGFLEGAILTIAVPEIIAGVNADDFSTS